MQIRMKELFVRWGKREVRVTGLDISLTLTLVEIVRLVTLAANWLGS